EASSSSSCRRTAAQSSQPPATLTLSRSASARCTSGSPSSGLTAARTSPPWPARPAPSQQAAEPLRRLDQDGLGRFADDVLAQGARGVVEAGDRRRHLGRAELAGGDEV